MQPYVSLGTYRWPKGGRFASKIGKALTDITRDLGLVPLPNDEIKRNPGAAWFSYPLHAEVRMTAVPGSEAEGWHQDGDTSTSQMDFGMVLWASKTHTLLKDASGKIWQPKPFEIVYINNLDVYHKRPDHIEGRRFQFRQRVKKATLWEYYY